MIILSTWHPSHDAIFFSPKKALQKTALLSDRLCASTGRNCRASENQNRGDFCDLLLQCPSRTPEIPSDFWKKSNAVFHHHHHHHHHIVLLLLRKSLMLSVYCKCPRTWRRAEVRHQRRKPLLEPLRRNCPWEVLRGSVFFLYNPTGKPPRDPFRASGSFSGSGLVLPPHRCTSSPLELRQPRISTSLLP